MGVEVHVAQLHEDVDVARGLREVGESDDIGVVNLVPDLHLSLDPLDDVVLQLQLGVVVSLLLGDLRVERRYLLVQVDLGDDLAGEPLTGVVLEPGDEDLAVGAASQPTVEIDHVVAVDQLGVLALGRLLGTFDVHRYIYYK